MMLRKIGLAGAAAAALLALAACETATPYQPLGPGHQASGGFTDTRLSADRFRVSFQGNTLTSRDTVETYLLYRAAELTVEQGGDWFTMADRETSRDRQTYYSPDPFYSRPGFGYGYWRPYWRYHGRGYGWRTWDPFFGDPFFYDRMDMQTLESFEATAEIIIHHGPKPPDDPRAFDAREVIANLGPRIQRPAP
jgi:hypothetical protein